jgi:hypothetical protein
MSANKEGNEPEMIEMIEMGASKKNHSLDNHDIPHYQGNSGIDLNN